MSDFNAATFLPRIPRSRDDDDEPASKINDPVSVGKGFILFLIFSKMF
jgi:hypothetical protein